MSAVRTTARPPDRRGRHGERGPPRLAAGGALAALWDAHIFFSMAYSRLWGLAARLSSPWYGAGQIGVFTAVIVALVWLLTSRSLVVERHGEHLDQLALLATVWLPVEVLLASTSGWHRAQCYLTWTIPAALLLGGAVSRLVDHLAARRADDRHAALALVLLGALVVVACARTLPASIAAARSLGGSVVRHERFARLRPRAQYAAPARYTDGVTKPSDTVLLWGGYSAQVDYLAGRASPTRYAIQLALHRPQHGAARVRTFLRDPEAHSRTLIIDTSVTYRPSSGYLPVPLLDGDAVFWTGRPAAFVEEWRAILDFVHRIYQVSRTLPFFPNWTPYVRNDQPLR